MDEWQSQASGKPHLGSRQSRVQPQSVLLVTNMVPSGRFVVLILRITFHVGASRISRKALQHQRGPSRQIPKGDENGGPGKKEYAKAPSRQRPWKEHRQ